MNKQESLKLVRLAFSQWSHIEPGEDLIEAFAMGLEPYSFGEARAAIANLLRDPSREYPPNTNQIVAGILGARTARAKEERLQRETQYAALPEPEITDSRRAQIVKEQRALHPDFFNYLDGIISWDEFRKIKRAEIGKGPGLTPPAPEKNKALSPVRELTPEQFEKLEERRRLLLGQARILLLGERMAEENEEFFKGE